MDLKKLEALAAALVKAMQVCTKAIQSLRKERLSYEELIKDITESKPDDSRVVQCAALKQVNNGVIEITVVYLDKDNQPVLRSADGEKDYGFAYTVKTIDPELTEIFAGKDMVIFQ